MMSAGLARTERISRIGSIAGVVVAVAGAVAFVTFAMSMASGETLQTLNDAALLVMIGALAPLMLAFYELGGRTPLRLAQLAQAFGWASVLAWCVIQVLQMTGAIAIDWNSPAAGAFAVASGALGYIGLWVAGANLLAGPWLTDVRWLGLLAGFGVVVFAVGLLLGGVDSGWTSLGGLGLLVALPVWGLLMARLLRERSAAAGTGRG